MLICAIPLVILNHPVLNFYYLNSIKINDYYSKVHSLMLAVEQLWQKYKQTNAVIPLCIDQSIHKLFHKYLHIILLPFLCVCSTLLPQSFQRMWKASVLSTICVVKIQASIQDRCFRYSIVWASVSVTVLFDWNTSSVCWTHALFSIQFIIS